MYRRHPSGFLRIHQSLPYLHTATLRKVVTSRDVIIDETKGYNRDIPSVHTEPVLESQLDPFVELVTIILYT
jgi:hypothetical protein